ncbi:MAG: DUF3817 domain-containing protein [Actinomycetota bacterium]|nr:DUF3817 domain-containing protein [Actinomycetota bacterium]
MIAPGALTRYRVLAFATGVLLLVLVFVAVPLEYWGHDDTLVTIVGPIHGWLYFGYLVTALMLAYQVRWSVGRTLLILLAGTVPFASFYAERVVVRDVRPRLREPSSA